MSGIAYARSGLTTTTAGSFHLSLISGAILLTTIPIDMIATIRFVCGNISEKIPGLYSETSASRNCATIFALSKNRKSAMTTVSVMYRDMTSCSPFFRVAPHPPRSKEPYVRFPVPLPFVQYLQLSPLQFSGQATMHDTQPPPGYPADRLVFL